MARKRSPERDKAFQLWNKSGGKMPLKDIAAALGVSAELVRKWKHQDKWCVGKVTLSKKNGNVTVENKSNVTNKQGKSFKKGASSELSPKDVLFVAEYLTDFNATRAAIAVGHSRKTASQIGYQLLQKSSVQAEIQRQTAIVADGLGLTTQRLLLERLKIAFADITQYVEFGQKEVQVMGPFGPIFDKDGKPVMKKVNHVTFKESAEVDGTLISQVKQGKDGVSIKLHDKQKALDVLDKYLDLLPDKFQRQVEEEKLKLQREKLAIERAKNMEPGADEEDDGFLEAMGSRVEDIWGKDPGAEDPETENPRVNNRGENQDE